MTQPSTTEPASGERRARRTRRYVLAIIVGGGAGIVVAVLATILWHRLHAMPVVTPERYVAARQRWDAAGIESYDLRIELSGNWSNVYQVEVRDGEVTQFTLDGHPVGNPRTLESWTVPGMFQTIGEDLARCARQQREAEEPATDDAAASEPRLTVRAHFDKQYGYPAEYLRIELGGQTDLTWRVTKFQPR